MTHHQRPIPVTATQWRRVGDHPRVEATPWQRRGVCDCGRLYSEHGCIRTDRGLAGVCPGDWIVEIVERGITRVERDSDMRHLYERPGVECPECGGAFCLHGETPCRRCGGIGCVPP